MKLTDRRPQLGASDLVIRFRPPKRFESVSFANYRPDPAHPTQAAALARVERFGAAGTPHGSKRAGRFWNRNAKPTSLDKPAIYLDGGFGVGKTHLLAALWHAGPKPAAYATFEELTAFVGFLGMANAIEALAPFRLVCIDEFELDDVANTLLVVSLLRGLIASGTRLAATSNTLPGQLGEQRFSASEFKREIAAIAAHFEELRIDGPDFRAGPAGLAPAYLVPHDATTTTRDEFDLLMAHLRTVHPVQYGAMFDGVSAVRIDGMRTIVDQDQALRWVHFVDKLYDAQISVEITGVDVTDVFDHTYRHKGYAKKYGRAESRLTAMRAESLGASES